LLTVRVLAGVEHLPIDISTQTGYNPPRTVQIFIDFPDCMPTTVATKPETKPAEDDEWLSLRDAAQLLGVHPATLRAWADRGRIASRRTAGRHRRFRRADLQAWLEASRASDASAQVLLHSALGHMRIQIERADAPWLARFDEELRRAHRELGHRLMQEIAHAVSTTELTAAVQAAAEKIGREYADLTRRRSLALTEALNAFLFFRDSLVDSLVQMAGALEPIAAPSWQSVHRQLSALLNVVLLALVKAYEDGERG